MSIRKDASIFYYGGVSYIGKLSGYYIQCENCGKTVYKSKTVYNKAKHHYCSNKCQKEFQHRLLFEDRPCEICGQHFHTSKKSKQRFCSTECQRLWQQTQKGELNPRFTSVHINCEYCEKEYFIKPCKLTNGQHHFCSAECRQKWYAEIWSQDAQWKEKSKQRAVKICKTGIGKSTKPQRIINELLNSMDIKYINEYNCKYYAVDNYLPQYNLMIEVMGDFWHCTPLKYNSPNMYDKQRRVVTRDGVKRKYIQDTFNINILYLWEEDIYKRLDVCRMLIEQYISSDGQLDNYHSFNYSIVDNELKLNNNIITPYQELQNVVNA